MRGEGTGRKGKETPGQETEILTVSTVMWALDQSMAVKREIGCKTKLSI